MRKEKRYLSEYMAGVTAVLFAVAVAGQLLHHRTVIVVDQPRSMPIVGTEWASAKPVNVDLIVVTIKEGNSIFKRCWVPGHYVESMAWDKFQDKIIDLTIDAGLDPIAGLNLDKIVEGQQVVIPHHRKRSDNWIRQAVFADPPLPQPKPEPILLAQAK